VVVSEDERLMEQVKAGASTHSESFTTANATGPTGWHEWFVTTMEAPKMPCRRRFSHSGRVETPTCLGAALSLHGLNGVLQHLYESIGTQSDI
jgi:hypothetical protein